MRKRIIPVVLMSLSIVAAACGSDDEAASTTAPAESTAPDETTAATTADTAVAGSDTTVSGGTGECTLDTPLKIGFAADLGELGAFSDGPGSEAAQVMVDILNDAGGVGGLPVEYVIKDIQGDPAATQRAAQELLDEGVNAIIGPPFASTGIKVTWGLIASRVPGMNLCATPSVEPLTDCGSTTRIGFFG
mgnify:CR=1 FL=1